MRWARWILVGCFVALSVAAVPSLRSQPALDAAVVPGSQYIAPTAWTEVPVYDTAWQMFGQASVEQADEYFEALKLNGFTGTWAGVIHHAPATYAHNYNGGGQIGSLIDGEIVLSEGYVARMIDILDAAEAHGMKVGLVVGWQNLYLPGGGADNGNPVSDTVRGTLTVDNAAAYGEQMVELFGDHPAVSMWVFGGDAGTNNTEENIEVWRVMAAAVRAAGSTLEITYHTPTSPFDQLNYAGEEWLDFIAPETGHGQDAAETEAELVAAANAYQIPVWQGEPRYFNINFNWVPAAYRDPGVDEVEADAQAAENAGVAGYVYGDAGRWNWCQGWGDSSPCDPDQIADSFGAGEAAVIEVFANPACGGEPCGNGGGAGGSVSYGTPPASGWGGFEVNTAPSGVGVGASPGWALGVTRDLGGAGTDVWVNNHGLQSEAIIDVGTAEQSIGLAADYGASPFVDTHGVAFGDIDGDGDEDLLEVSGRNSPNRLFVNDGGVLVPVDPGPLEDFLGRGRQPIFLDFDGDGDMDVLVTNLDLREPPVNLEFNEPSAVYLNDGTGLQWTKLEDPTGLLSNGNRRLAHLTSVSPGEAPIVITHRSYSVADDSLVTGQSTLAASATPATARSSSHVRDVVLADFDNDLHPEVLVVRGNETDETGLWPLQLFDIVEGDSPVAVPQLPIDPLIDNCRSAAAADFDNDGDVDILVGCAHRQQGQLRNVVLLNDGTGVFSVGGVELLEATGAETAAAIVTADLNDDGWVDAWVSNGYDFENAVDHVYGNRTGSNNWLMLDLVGSNPDVAGAQVFVGTDGWQVRETGHRFHRSQDMRSLHFGLGDAEAVADLLIRWPDGTFEACPAPAINARVSITQGAGGCTALTQADVLAALAEAPRDPQPLVVINEIHYNPAPGGVEFVELHSIHDTAVDLGGFELPGLMTIPVGTTISPGGFVVVTADLPLFQAVYPGVAALPWAAGVELSNEGQRVALVAPNGLVVDEVFYGDGVNDPIPDEEEPNNARYSVAQVIDGTIGAGDGSNPNEDGPMGLHDAPLYLPQSWDWAQGSTRNDVWGTFGTGSANFAEFRCAVFPENGHTPPVPFRINVRNAAYWQFGDAGWTKGFDVDLQPGANGAYLGTAGVTQNPFDGPNQGAIQWRQEADGSFSAPWNADSLMLHFWANQRQAPSAGQIAEFTTSEFRLQQPDGEIVDLGSVRVLFQCGVDYYETTGGQGVAVPGPGIGTYHLATTEWSPSLWVTLPGAAPAASTADFRAWLEANLPPEVGP